MQMYDKLVGALEPYLTDELDNYVEAIAAMFAELEEYVGYGDDVEGLDDWSILFDVDECPAPALPYLAQMIGEQLPTGLDEDASRQWITDQPNHHRGTVDAIFSAAKRSLTGTQLVTVIERSGGVPAEDHLQVITYADQTPDPNQVLADLKGVMPADIALHYDHSPTGLTWQQLKVGTWGTSWNLVKTHYPSWAAVAADRTSGIIA